MSSYTAIPKNTGSLFGGGPKKRKTKEVEVDNEPPTITFIIPVNFNTIADLQEQKASVDTTNARFWPVCLFPSSICASHISIVKEDCNRPNLEIFAPEEVDRITFSKADFTFL